MISFFGFTGQTENRCSVTAGSQNMEQLNSGALVIRYLPLPS
jgi:hypothetical protein